MSKYLRDNAKFLLFSEIYFKFQSHGSKRKALAIVESAIQLFAKKGFENTTLNMIVNDTGLSRSTIFYYFSTLEEIQLYSLKYIRVLYQSYVVSTLKEKEKALESFDAYFDSCFKWPELFGSYTSVWLNFLYKSRSNKKFCSINSEAVEVGFYRLISIIDRGCEEGVFKCQNSRDTARIIHLLITGLLLSEATERDELIESQRDKVKEECLRLLMRA